MSKCELCKHPLVSGSKIIMRRCGHQFCRKCIEIYTSSLRLQSVIKGKCPSDGDLGCFAIVFRTELELHLARIPSTTQHSNTATVEALEASSTNTSNPEANDKSDNKPKSIAKKCPLCEQKFKDSTESISLESCSHIFCRDCLVYAIETSPDPHVPCPFPISCCSGIITKAEVRKLVNPLMLEVYLNRLIPKTSNEVGRQITSDVTKLPPIIFQFRHGAITIGMSGKNGEPTIVRNGNGEEITPLVVGVNEEHKLVYGSDAISADTGGVLKQYWNVWNIIISANENFVDIFRLDNVEHKISAEFLLGYILSNLKDEIESSNKGVCSTAVITIPFWFCTLQRFQVKNAAKTAGFTDVHLINEDSAAALYVASKHNILNNMLVLSQHEEKIDASIFHYSGSGQFKTIHRVSHFGGYYSQDAKPKLYYEQIKNFLTWTQEDYGSRKLILKQVIQGARNKLLDAGYNSIGCKADPLKGFVLCTKSEWRTMMDSVCKNSQIELVEMDWKILFGAVLLSENPEMIGSRICDKIAYTIKGRDENNEWTIRHVNQSLPKLERSYPYQLISFDKEIDIFQRLLQKRTLIGKLVILKNTCHTIHLVCTESYDGLFDITCVSDSRPSVTLTEEEDFQWFPTKMSNEDVERNCTLIKSLSIIERTAARN